MGYLQWIKKKGHLATLLLMLVSVLIWASEPGLILIANHFGGEEFLASNATPTRPLPVVFSGTGTDFPFMEKEPYESPFWGQDPFEYHPTYARQKDGNEKAKGEQRRGWGRFLEEGERKLNLGLVR